jgi:hypothetical protein
MSKRPNVLNRHNEHKKRIVIPPSFSKIVLLAGKLGVSGAIIFFVGNFTWRYLYKTVTESYTPNAGLFEECSPSFIQIKQKPAYGVVFKTSGTLVNDIYLTAPSGISEVKAIHLESKDWVGVFFSKNFSLTQVGEFLRLSKLETGSFNFCYILEQLSLTSGVPVEFALVEDTEKGLSSTVSIADSRAILLSIEQQAPKSFKRELLPLRLLDDGTKVAAITYDSFVEQFPTFFELEGVAQEQAFVEVYNSTDIDGYASIFAKRWGMLGIDVSRVGNAEHEELNNVNAVLYVKDETRFVRTLSMIKSSFPEGSVTIRTGRPANVMSTGDIVVFLLNR